MYGDQFGELVCSYWDLHSGGNRKCLYQRGVRIKRVEFRGNLRAFFLQGRSKLRKAEFDCKLCRTFKNPHTFGNVPSVMIYLNFKLTWGHQRLIPSSLLVNCTIGSLAEVPNQC